MIERPEVMSSSRAAALLAISKTTLLKWAEGGIVPGVKVGSRWWFRRRELERWLEGPTVPSESPEAGGDALRGATAAVLGTPTGEGA